MVQSGVEAWELGRRVWCAMSSPWWGGGRAVPFISSRVKKGGAAPEAVLVVFSAFQQLLALYDSQECPQDGNTQKCPDLRKLGRRGASGQGRDITPQLGAVGDTKRRRTLSPTQQQSTYLGNQDHP